MSTPRAGGLAQPEGILMTHDQYLDLKNEYRAMMEKLRKYNEHRAFMPLRLRFSATLREVARS